MIIVRFYSQDPVLEALAKYKNEEDLDDEKIKKMCRPIVRDKPRDEDNYSHMNKQFCELDAHMPKYGFERLPLVDCDDHDKAASAAYDIVVNPAVGVVTILSFDVRSIEGTDEAGRNYGDVAKTLRGKYTLQQIAVTGG